MRKYGSHYKVNGPCVNVPTTLDQVIHMLPHMSDQLQLHPVKLKRKLEYKSHYMFHLIRKDKVMGAITWLKNNNSHYKNIKLNSNWFNSIESSELSTLLSGVREDDHISQQPCNDNADSIKQNTSVAEMDNCNGHNNIIQKRHVNNAYNEPRNVNHGGDICHVSGNEKDDKNDSMNSLTATEVSDQVMRTQDTCSDDDSELDEDQAALDHRQQLTGDALPTVVQIDNLENQMYQCAPGENNIPKFILLDDDFEVLAFPDLFPDGTGAYHSPNGPEHLGIWKYFQQCLLNVDICFAQNIEYLFCAQYIADIKQIQNDANLAICMS